MAGKKPGTIPRTLSGAKAQGFKRAPYKFSDLQSAHKASFVSLDGGRPGSLCGVAPSPDPSYWLVCYKDANGQCNWVHVPRAAAPNTHD